MFNRIKIPENLRPKDLRFGPGPSLISEQYVKELLDKGQKYLGTAHRKKAVKDTVKNIQEGLKSYFDLPSDFEVLIGNGGATALFDTIGLGLVEKESFHHVLGEFSKKWFDAHKLIPAINTEQVSCEFGQGLELTSNLSADLVCLTLNETSTGVMCNDFSTIKTNGLIAVDATSGAGQIPCDISKTDFFFFSAQKIFAGEGGLWLALASHKALERAKKIYNEKSRYIPQFMNLRLIIDNSIENQTYNTPCLSGLYFLMRQIEDMNKYGYENVIAMAKKKAQLVYAWAESKPYLSSYVKDEKFRSLSVATIDIDSKFDVKELCQKLRDENWAYDIESYRKLNRNQLRIAMFHNIAFEDLEKLTLSISYLIENANR